MNLSRWLGLCLAPALRERGLLRREKGTSGMALTFHRSEVVEEVVDKVEVSTEEREVESYDGPVVDERTLGHSRSNLDIRLERINKDTQLILYSPGIWVLHRCDHLRYIVEAR